MRIRLLGLLAACAARAATADVQFAIDATRDVAPISRFVYGVNRSLDGDFASATFTRLGGNRWTAYNWENNASNAGTDWFNQNDSLLSSSDTPGEAVRPAIAAARAQGAGILVTVPIEGYVAADKNGGGDVNQTPNYLQTRFRQSLPAKGAPFTPTPDAGDGFVYQDEFVSWVAQTFPGAYDAGHPIFYSLDNEPDLWSSTHVRIHPDPLTYAELEQRTIDFASAIKAVSPDALIFGPVNYGWYGYTTLQGAPDAGGHDFQAHWLDAVSAASQAFGAPLVDVLDVHWYPEAQGGGVRITGTDTGEAVVAARLQAPRSLWDPTYTETSWISQYSTLGPIRLLPLLREKIAAHGPGMRLAITEYNYGAGQHVSGGLAQADVLGVFGREGVFAAAEWPLAGDESFIAAAFRMYRDFDGAGAHFGDLSVRATTSDDAASSVYASLDSGDPARMVLVAINKTASPLPATFAINAPDGRALAGAHVHRLTAATPAPVSGGDIAPSPGQLADTLPAYSVSTIEVMLPEPDGTAAAGLAAIAGLALRARLTGRRTARCPPRRRVRCADPRAHSATGTARAAGPAAA
jgi:hypothetical protein